MTSPVKKMIRPLALPLIHRWQYCHDYALGKLRERRERRERQKMLRDADPVLQDIHGFRFVLYPFDRANLAYILRRGADVKEFAAIPLLVRPGDTAFDVGANAGTYAVLLSRLCGSGGRVWAFEPVPETYWRLRENLALNRCENVVAVRGAVCERGGTVRMNLFESQHSEWNTLGSPAMHGEKGRRITPSDSLEVPAYSLDEFCASAGISRINFLKVDVEGFELSVFRGASRLLRENRVDYICFEISQEPLKGAGVKSRQVFEAVEEYGYNAYLFQPKASCFSGPIRDTSEEWINIFASRKDLLMSAFASSVGGGERGHDESPVELSR